MGLYAVFRSKDYYGLPRDEREGKAVEPPVPGAFESGEFWPYGGGLPEDACIRWVLEVRDLGDLVLLGASLNEELIFAAPSVGKYSGCSPELWDGIDGVIEVYDYYRE